MSIENATLAFAGFMVILSVILTYFVHPYFVALTIFVGLNLFQSAFTGFCPASRLLGKLGLKSAAERESMKNNLPSEIGLTQ